MVVVLELEPLCSCGSGWLNHLMVVVLGLNHLVVVVQGVNHSVDVDLEFEPLSGCGSGVGTTWWLWFWGIEPLDGCGSED